MILLIDNYDSFSYNLVQLIGGIQKERYDRGLSNAGRDCDYGIRVIRNDELTVEEIEALNPEFMILSPGPGRPKNAGICETLLKEYGGSAKILGVCLGHQAIVEAFGGKITYAKTLMHGKQSEISIDSEEAVFRHLPETVKVARYHSLAGDAETMPECLKVIAKTADGEIMAVRHKEKEIYGFQFHPESVLTEYGKTMLENFLDLGS
ncbi:MAG: aminodeoxychorismate/anthranilate synthase component II [Bacteroidales bacterium]|nr:aminodeoxychorismate/anthranilate synthase component II [Clostridium sp.]MCM1203263.1 aminodeoxychorismate/anthranilate synthase component II [Bacteroidales bacterium]